MEHKIGIFIPTCQRIDMLKNLLENLINNEFIRNNCDNIFIYVVDNDKNKSSKDTVENLRSKQIKYFVEKERGYSIIRNKCIEIAKIEDCDYLVFIDDDEYPCKEWLLKLYNKALLENLDAVIGPVYLHVDDNLPKWIKDNKQDFDRIDEKARYTGNIILKMSSIRDITFDNNFNNYGGEDVQFFKDMEEKKMTRIMFEKEAKVFEYLPLERTKLIYFIKRGFRSGISDVIANKKFYGLTVNLKLLSKAIINIIIGFIYIIPTIFMGKNEIRKKLMIIAKGFGRLYGLIFIKYNNKNK